MFCRTPHRPTRVKALLLGVGMILLVIAGVGCPPEDTTPPANATSLQALTGDGEIRLTWTNPGDGDFAAVRIQRLTSGYAAYVGDGTTVYEGSLEEYPDAGLTNGTTYYYTVFSYDGVPNYSSGVQVAARPQWADAQKDVLDEMAALDEDIEAVEDTVLDPAQRTGLVTKLGKAEWAYVGGDPCAAGEFLTAYLVKVQEFRQGDAAGVTDGFYNRGRQLRYDILANEGCSGAERVGKVATAGADEQQTDNTQAVVDIAFGEPVLKTIVSGQETFTEVCVPGTSTDSAAPGEPAVPIIRRLLAAPRGAKLNVEVQYGGSETFLCNLIPCQHQPADQNPENPGNPPDPSIFDTPGFVKDEAAYAGAQAYPVEPWAVHELGSFRDLRLLQLEVAAGRYSPATQELTLYEDVTVDVTFGGGSGAFLTEAAMHEFESTPSVYTQSVLNSAAVERYIEGWLRPSLSGEEFMILAPPSMNAEAIALRDWKRSKGIMTNVYTVADGGGSNPDTAAEIDSFIESHYYTVAVRPSYILLLGDAEIIPPFYPAANNADLVGSTTIGSDWEYSILGNVGLDLVPDFAVGRIPVDTAAQAAIVVNKIIQYEQNPPMNAGFYSAAAIAAQFECCRWDVVQDGTALRTFTEAGEFCRDVLVAQGKTVDRIYEDTVDWRYGARDATPRRYYDGATLPADLAPGSGFAWNGGTVDILTAWNEGRFLMIHRDHGWEGGWSHPDFAWSDIASLTNSTLQPVVFSVNCASGLFDNETAGGVWGTTDTAVYFAERLLRKSDGGCVGFLGDTRNSPSWPNTELLKGFMDAIWHDAIPSYGASAPHRRLGDILNHGKLYMMTQVGAAGAGVESWDAKDELLLWHCLGDPTMEIWTSYPYTFSLPSVFDYLTTTTQFVRLVYPVDGALVTAYQIDGNDEVIAIARGVVEDGSAVLPYFNEPDPKYTMHYAVSLAGSVAKLVTP
ncbi:MAG: hypothetical protein GWP08_20245 [Nitrospiraceae bacterium]|nr:hypothetical protein [Nitrospiraceae bacterium]